MTLREELEERLLTKISAEWPARTPAAQDLIRYVAKVATDAVEQESADLRLLLSAMCRGVVWIPLTGGVSVRLGPEATWFDCKLDSYGIPVLTQEIVEALKNAK